MPVDQKLYDRAARETQRDARILVAAAESLAKSGQFGIGRSLIVIAMEETAKATEFKAIAMGLASTDPRDAPKKRHVSKGDLYGHGRKLYRLGTIAYAGVFLDALRPVITALVQGKSPDTTDDKVTRPAIERFVRVLDEMDSMIREREDGFYVDVRDNSVVSPRAINAQEYKRRLVDARYCVDLSEQWISIDVPEEVMARLRPLIRQIARIEEVKVRGFLEHRRRSTSR